MKSPQPTLKFSHPPGSEPKSVPPRSDVIKLWKKPESSRFSKESYVASAVAATTLIALGSGAIDYLGDMKDAATEAAAVQTIGEGVKNFIESPGTELVRSDEDSWYFAAESPATVALVAEDVLDQTGATYTVETEESATTVSVRIDVHETVEGKTLEIGVYEQWPDSVYNVDIYHPGSAVVAPSIPAGFEAHASNKHFVLGVKDDVDVSTLASAVDALGYGGTELIEAAVYTDDSNRSVIEDVGTLLTISKSLFEKSPNNPYGLEYRIDQQLNSDVVYTEIHSN